MKNQFSAGPEDAASAAIRDVDCPVLLKANHMCLGQVEAVIVGFDKGVASNGFPQFGNSLYSAGND
jgi:hypothetical protein